MLRYQFITFFISATRTAPVKPANLASCFSWDILKPSSCCCSASTSTLKRASVLIRFPESLLDLSSSEVRLVAALDLAGAMVSELRRGIAPAAAAAAAGAGIEEEEEAVDAGGVDEEDEEEEVAGS